MEPLKTGPSDFRCDAYPRCARGFTVLPRRWAVERTLGWLMHHRRLARDYETLPARSTARIYLAMIALMARRLTRESTPTWRGL
ncbi:transposase [Streptomyces sp. SAI-135]|nr:transposase [Streptomyces sp. SAI-090]MDH6554152.1 transposase [Streptomyces sp. SAI-041]MDH6573416.1 transposase [Streptomyces sp. SAI-117]MDH6613851.1 transposase [Streptomyces sp. SAI-135]